MDADRFDTLCRTLTATSSRRVVAHTLAGLTGSGLLRLVLGDTETAAKKRKKKKKKKGKSGSPPASSPPPRPTAPPSPSSPPPSPPGATCTDNVRNGRETDVDCGGPDCPRCFDGQACTFNEDCRTARCVNGVCRECATDQDCGTDAAGQCRCQAGACLHLFGHAVASCSECRADELCSASIGAPGCFPYCGTSRTCALENANTCLEGDDIPCGRAGACFGPIAGGPSRCGSLQPDSCGCTSDQACAATYGAGAFCVGQTGLCECAFCATPA
jgi:hypothetical protein